MQNFHGNVSSSIFYGTVSSDILHIAKSSSSVLSFDGKINELITRMEKHCGNRRKLIKVYIKQRYFKNIPMIIFFKDTAGGRNYHISHFSLWEMKIPLITLVT